MDYAFAGCLNEIEERVNHIPCEEGGDYSEAMAKAGWSRMKGLDLGDTASALAVEIYRNPGAPNAKYLACMTTEGSDIRNVFLDDFPNLLDFLNYVAPLIAAYDDNEERRVRDAHRYEHCDKPDTKYCPLCIDEEKLTSRLDRIETAFESLERAVYDAGAAT